MSEVSYKAKLWAALSHIKIAEYHLEQAEKSICDNDNSGNMSDSDRKIIAVALDFIDDYLGGLACLISEIPHVIGHLGDDNGGK